MAVEIESADVVRLVMQFLQEQGLGRSLAALQEETDVALNTVDSVEEFVADVAAGRWDSVLRQTASLKLAPEKLMALFEQIVRELAEVRELGTARELMRSSVPLRMLREAAPDRHARLEVLLKAPSFDAKDAYPDGSSKERRRADVAAMLAEDLTVVPGGRLVSLLGQAVKWQRHTGRLPLGSRFDVFRNAPPRRREEADAPCTRPAGSAAFGDDSRATCACFSADGAHLITGSHDGFVEVWDAETGRLDTRLPYQARDELMLHDDAVLCASTSDDAALLATGCRDGGVKVWDLAAGSCLLRFPAAHAGGVASVRFSRDGATLLTAGSDAVARVHGLRSGKTLKELRGHGSFVHSARFSADGSALLTASADGTARVWSAATCETTATLTPPQASATAAAAVLDAVPLPGRGDAVLLLTRGSAAHVVAMDGSLLRTIVSPGADLVSAVPSPRSRLLHALTSDRQLRCFDLDTGEEVAAAAAAEAGEVELVVQHPRRNRVAVVGSACGVRFFGPAVSAAAAAAAAIAARSRADGAGGAAAASSSSSSSAPAGVITTSGDTL